MIHSRFLLHNIIAVIAHKINGLSKSSHGSGSGGDGDKSEVPGVTPPTSVLLDSSSDPPPVTQVPSPCCGLLTLEIAVHITDAVNFNKGHDEVSVWCLHQCTGHEDYINIAVKPIKDGHHEIIGDNRLKFYILSSTVERWSLSSKNFHQTKLLMKFKTFL